MKRIIAVIFATLVLLSACSKPTSLVNSKWQLVKLVGKPALTDVSLTLNFGENSIGGNDGCNSYGGSYTSTESTIKFGSDIVSTLMYCTDEIANQSYAYFDILSKVTEFKVDSQLLTLFNADGMKLAEFIPFKE